MKISLKPETLLSFPWVSINKEASRPVDHRTDHGQDSLKWNKLSSFHYFIHFLAQVCFVGDFIPKKVTRGYVSQIEGLFQTITLCPFTTTRTSNNKDHKNVLQK